MPTNVSTTIPSRVGTAQNLQTGGSYDLLLIKFEGAFPEGKISFGIYDTPMKITGIQKAAQVFLKLLFTGRGSDPFYPQRGTAFPNLVVGANVLTDDPTFLSELRTAVNDAAYQARSSSSVANIDTSSILDTVDILGLDKVGEGIIMYLKMTTLAGASASVALPFPEFGLG